MASTEILGQKSTQSVLNTFHVDVKATASGRQTTMVDSLAETLYLSAPKQRTVEFATVSKTTFAECYELSLRVVHLTIHDFVTKYTALSETEFSVHLDAARMIKFGIYEFPFPPFVRVRHYPLSDGRIDVTFVEETVPAQYASAFFEYAFLEYCARRVVQQGVPGVMSAFCRRFDKSRWMVRMCLERSNAPLDVCALLDCTPNAHRWIDRNSIVDSHVVHNAPRMGICGVRNVIISRLYGDIIRAGDFVDPAHIMFQADNITFRGTLNGATFAGANRAQAVGPVQRAAHGKPLMHLANGALHGRSDNTENGIPAICTGRRVQVGTERVHILVDPAQLVQCDAWGSRMRPRMMTPFDEFAYAAAKRQRPVCVPLYFSISGGGDGIPPAIVLEEEEEEDTGGPELERMVSGAILSSDCARAASADAAALS